MIRIYLVVLGWRRIPTIDLKSRSQSELVGNLCVPTSSSV